VYPHYPYPNYPRVFPIREILRGSAVILEYALLDRNNELRDISGASDIEVTIYDEDGVLSWSGTKSGGEVSIPTDLARGNIEIHLLDTDTHNLAVGAYTIVVNLVYPAPDSDIKYTLQDVLVVNESSMSVPPSVAPDSYNFGSITVGATSLPQNFIVTNSTQEDIIITEIKVAGTDALDFVATPSGSGSWTVPKNGGTLSVAVVFTPGDLGTRNAVLEFLSAINTLSVPIWGTGV